LIAALACRRVICPDGAMHLAAALGKPVALFGDSPASAGALERAAPRAAPSRNLADLPLEPVLGRTGNR
jgi:ADP-heptose:LPS heptosyltransferase